MNKLTHTGHKRNVKGERKKEIKLMDHKVSRSAQNKNRDLEAAKSQGRGSSMNHAKLYSNYIVQAASELASY